MFRDFADVQKAIGPGNDFDESAELSEAAYFPEIGLANFGGRSEIADNLQGLVGRLLVVRGDVDLAGILNVDLDAGLLDDAADHFAAGPDDVANLVNGNLQGVDAGRVGRDLHARFVEHLIHLFEDEKAPALRLGE